MEIQDYMIIITEADAKLNKWHIAMEKLYRKPTETEQNFKKRLWHDSEIEPRTQNSAGESFPNELAGNSVELV